jgi:glutaredoxin
MQGKSSGWRRWSRAVCLSVAACTLTAAPAVESGTVYRLVDADGKIIYGDQPPASAKVERQLHIVNAPASPLPESVLRYPSDIEKCLKKRLTDAATPFAGVSQLFTTKTCGYCKHAKAYLAQKGLPYQEHDIETPDGMMVYAATGGSLSGVPVLVQNDKRLVGFSLQIYDAFSGQARK